MTLKWLILCYVNFASMKINKGIRKNSYASYEQLLKLFWVLAKEDTHSKKDLEITRRK